MLKLLVVCLLGQSIVLAQTIDQNRCPFYFSLQPFPIPQTVLQLTNQIITLSFCFCSHFFYLVSDFLLMGRLFSPHRFEFGDDHVGKLRETLFYYLDLRGQLFVLFL